jgi:hypothetical protein
VVRARNPNLLSFILAGYIPVIVWRADSPRHHCGKEENEREILSESAGFGFVCLTIPCVVIELERKKRNAQGKKRALPADRVGPSKERQPCKKVPVFEDPEDGDALQESENAPTRAGHIESAYDRLPQKNQEAQSSPDSCHRAAEVKKECTAKCHND